MRPGGDPLIEQLRQAQPRRQRRRQQQTRVGDQRVLIGGYGQPIQRLRSSHQEGAPDLLDDFGVVTEIVQVRSTLFQCLPPTTPCDPVDSG
jgi:hypothetical protein